MEKRKPLYLLGMKLVQPLWKTVWRFLKKLKIGNSLAVQWLGLSTFIAGAQVQSVVGELGSHKPHGAAKKKKKQPKNRTTI